MISLEAQHKQDGSMMFFDTCNTCGQDATLADKMRHLRTRCDTYNTCNDDTCDTIEVSNFEV
jgi:hypothetical protein